MKLNASSYWDRFIIVFLVQLAVSIYLSYVIPEVHRLQRALISIPFAIAIAVCIILYLYGKSRKAKLAELESNVDRLEQRVNEVSAQRTIQEPQNV